MADPKSVLFVCTGNTCRSPMAEALFRKAVSGRDHLTVGSAGVMARNGGQASGETLAVLRKRQAPLDNFRSRAVTGKILEEASHVFAMTESHLAHLEAAFPEFAGKYYLLGEFAADALPPGASHDVPDPIGMGIAAYEEVADVFEAAIPTIIAFLESGT